MGIWQLKQPYPIYFVNTNLRSLLEPILAYKPARTYLWPSNWLT